MTTYTTPFFLLLLLAFLSCAPKQQAPGANNAAKESVAWTAAWSYDDKFIAVGNDKGELAIYETAGWKKVKSWSYKSATITRVEWNPKHPVLAVAAVWHEGSPSIPQLYDISKDRIIRTIPDSIRGRGVSWKPGGEEVAFVGNEGRISIFGSGGDFRKTLSYTNPGALFDIDWHPTKNTLLAVEEDIYLIDAERDSLVATYEDGTTAKGILCCQWHPSGDLFVTGDYGAAHEGGEPSLLKYWSAAGALLTSTKESGFEYRNIRWSKNGAYLAAAGDRLLVFDKKGALISKTKFDNNNLWGIEWNSTGDKILTSDGAGTVRVTDRKGKVLKVFRL